MKEIDLPPYAPLLMESTRALGYSLEAAIADIMDNSVSAGATEVSIKFLPFGDPFLSILDNGSGMNSEEITAAMRYGSKNPSDTRDKDDLGRFGLGLKTASLSQCRKLTVVSLKNNNISGRCWDLDRVTQSGKWSLQVLEDKELMGCQQIELLKKQGVGTLVILENLDRISTVESEFQTVFSEKMIRVRNHLSLVFHRYLSGELGLKKIKMDINGELLVAQDPFLISKSVQVMDDERINIGNHFVTVKPFILPHISKITNDEIRLLGGKDGLKNNQGFYVYRNKRLLVWGTWFRLIRKGDLSKLARVQVDIPNTLDPLWSIDIRKSIATPPEIVRKNLSRIVDSIAERSKKTWTFRGRKETDDSFIHLWKRIITREGIQYDINRDHPLLSIFKEKLEPHDLKYLEQLLSLIESNIPLNSLYVDLTNDEKMLNDKETVLTGDLKELALMLMTNYKTKDEQNKFLECLEVTPPFSTFSKEILEYLNGVKS